MVIAVDGGRTRIRHVNTGKRRHNCHRHGYKAEWIEPKLLTIYAVDQHWLRVNTAEKTVTNDATYGKLQPFLYQFKQYLRQIEHLGWKNTP